MVDNLVSVHRAAAKSAAARSAFMQAIRDASAAGASTRDIAKAAELSHQRVWQILRGE